MIGNKKVTDMVTKEWIINDFIPSVQHRSFDIIKLRKLSAAASVGKATVDQMRDWVFGSSDWQSLALYNDNSNHKYQNIPSDIVISLPHISVNDGDVEVVPDLQIDDPISQEMFEKTINEILSDRKYIEHLL